MLFHTVGHGGHAIADSKTKKLSRSSGEVMEDGGPDFDPDAMTAFRFWFDAYPGDTLPASPATVEALDALGNAMVDLSKTDNEVDATPDSTIPPVYTYWSQFIDHELTARTDREEDVSKIDGTPAELEIRPREEIEAQLKNRRTPGFELDAVYGDGAPHAVHKPSGAMLDLAQKLRDGAKMRVGTVITDGIPGEIPAPSLDLQRDLPRIGAMIDAGVVTETDFPEALRSKDNFRSNAFIGDPRNDENLAVAQFHTAILRFHNAIVDWLQANHPIDGETDDQLFERARRICRWTFQWLVVNDFLPTIANQGVVASVVESRAPHYRELFNKVYGSVMPLEFSVGAYRFGHSMVRNAYDYNINFGRGPSPLQDRGTLNDLFQFTGGSQPPFRFNLEALPSNWIIDWDRFVDADPNDADGKPARVARKIDTQLAPSLGRMTNQEEGLMKHLARRNLRRSYVLNIPTGEAAAKFFGVPAIDPGDVTSNLDDDTVATMQAGGLIDHTPLWYYVLREAELAGGDRLGALGSTMVAETFVGVMVTDPHSYLAQQPNWHPGQPIPGNGPSVPMAGTETKIGHLFEFAGVKVSATS